MEYTRENVTIEDIRRVLSSEGYWLRDDEWDGTDPVKAYGLNPYTPWARQAVEIDLGSIISWLNVDSGFFDPVSMGI